MIGLRKFTFSSISIIGFFKKFELYYKQSNSLFSKVIMKKILFCCYGGGHVQSLLPVIKRLNILNKYDIRVFGLTIAAEVLRQNQIGYFSYKDLFFHNPSNIKNIGTQLSATLNSQKIDKEETIAYLGANMQELIDTYGIEKAEELYQKNGRACFYPLSLMTQLIQAEKPDLVVATNSPRTEKAIIQAAFNLNIPTLCLIDGFAKYESEWIASPSFCKYVGVISESVKKTLINLGKSEKDIYITGNPAFDTFASPCALEEQIEMKKKISINNNQKVIMYAPSPEGRQHIFTGQPADSYLPEKILDKLITFVGAKTDLFLIIRPHPSQKFELDLDNLPNNIFYDQGNDLRLMLSISDLLVTFGSTVGVQAQLLNKPIICCNQSVYANDTDYEDFGYVKRIHSINKLESAINQELEKEKVSQNQQTKNNTLAAENVQRLIDQILS